MKLDQRLESVAVLGAGGKMGSGISLLLAREMTMLQLKQADKSYRLTLMDISSEALDGLKAYLAKQAARYVQKQGEKMAEELPGIPSEALEETFVNTMQAILNPITDLKELPQTHMVFEAILEKTDLKIRVYKELKERCPNHTYFFSNTSSIPLHTLDKVAGLSGRIIGFHFYNPPAVQKLVELIIPSDVDPQLPEISREIGKRLGKIIIPSNDLAGFIGNGHFMRDGLHGISEVETLRNELGFAGAVHAINRVSQDFLLRPMGIFQLIDYVGLDIFQSILKIMDPAFGDELLHSTLIDNLVESGVRGGQYSDGSQKNGFFKYEAGKPVAVYSLDDNNYLALGEHWQSAADNLLGSLPDGYEPWKTLVRDPDRNAKLTSHFRKLGALGSNGAELAKSYLLRSKAIGEKLVSDGVANNADDVNGVLMNGFFHLYGPINDYA
ncbi:MAG: 3-hydroxyacyl-CoA dehydrogenase family protein [Calditrichia bacterium]